MLWEDGVVHDVAQGKAVNRVKNVRRCSLRWCNTALSSLHNRNNGSLLVSTTYTSRASKSGDGLDLHMASLWDFAPILWV